MGNCINSCQLCNSLIISDNVSIVTLNDTDTLVVDIPSGVYANNSKVCLVIAQTIPDTATINMPVVISIAGSTTTVYPVVDRCCNQVTACALRTRRRYSFRVSTNANGAVFRSLGGLSCTPNYDLPYIPNGG